MISLGILLGFGSVYRLLLLGEPIGNDEVFTLVHFAIKPIRQFLFDHTVLNNHILYTALMHASVARFGISFLGLRLPALIAGIGILPLTYAAGVRWTQSRIVALFALFWTAVSWALIHYSVDGRGYSLQTFFTLILILATRPIETNSRMLAWTRVAVSAVTVTAILWTIPSGIVVVFPWAMFWLIRGARQQERMREVAVLFISALALMGACLLPGASHLQGLHELKLGSPSIVAWKPILRGFLDAGAEVLPVWLLILLTVAGLWKSLDMPARLYFSLTFALYPIVALISAPFLAAVSLYPRSYVPIYPMLYICAATGLVWFHRFTSTRVRFIGPAMMGALVLFGCLKAADAWIDRTQLFFPDRELCADGERVANEVVNLLKPGDRVWAGPIPLDAVSIFCVVRRFGFRGYYSLPTEDGPAGGDLFWICPGQNEALAF